MKTEIKPQCSGFYFEDGVRSTFERDVLISDNSAVGDGGGFYNPKL
jgi:hypothetical protein